MSKIETGGPAYPVTFEGGKNNGDSPYFHEGMSLRDKVALEVFVRLATDQELTTFYEQDATNAFAAADAFLAARGGDRD